MAHVLTLVAARAATTLTGTDIDAVRDAIGGGDPIVLSPGEAVDIPIGSSPDIGRVRAAQDLVQAGLDRARRLRRINHELASVPRPRASGRHAKTVAETYFARVSSS